MGGFLIIFLLFDGFIMGVLATVAWRHGMAHFRPHTHDLEHSHHLAKAAPGAHLPPAVRQQLLETAQLDFQRVLKHAAQDLQGDLADTATDIKKQLASQGSDAVKQELERYRARVAELEQQTEAAMAGSVEAVSEHQAELRAKMQAEVEAEKQRLLAQIDTKLADAVATFLLETLQHNVDLGSQTAYLTSQLEAHKADFAKEVSDEL